VASRDVALLTEPDIIKYQVSSKYVRIAIVANLGLR